MFSNLEFSQIHLKKIVLFKFNLIFIYLELLDKI